MIVSNSKELSKYKDVCNVSVSILRELYDMTVAGVFPMEVELKAQELLRKHNATGSFFGVKGEYNSYKYITCISVNDTIVHGIPSKTQAFLPGDVIKLDFGLIKDGYYTDHCVTVVLKPSQEKDLTFVQAAKTATLNGVAAATIGNMTGDIGNAIYSHLKSNGYEVAKEYIGHGIGRTLHDKPAVPAFGREKTGAQLKEGMILCVEAQVVEGSDKWYLEKDGWTVKTSDGKNAAMFEYMVVVQKDQPLILTDTTGWPITKEV